MGRPTTIGKINAVTPGGMSTAPLNIAATTSGIIPMDYRGGNFQATLALIINGTGGSFSADYTADDLQGIDSNITGTGSLQTGVPPTEAQINWFPHATLANLAASAISNIAFPVTAIRLRCTTASAGTGAWLRVIQTPVVGG